MFSGGLAEFPFAVPSTLMQIAFQLVLCYRHLCEVHQVNIIDYLLNCRDAVFQLA